MIVRMKGEALVLASYICQSDPSTLRDGNVRDESSADVDEYIR